MHSDKLTTFEQDKRFSECCVWGIQKEYYQSKGIEAWSESVPFYITSNAFIANRYAKAIVSFIYDWVKQNPKSTKHVFPILETGAGTGQLTYYLCMQIQEQLAARSLGAVKIKYIVSDISAKNLTFIRKHPSLQMFIEQDILHFSLFDAENDDQLRMVDANNEPAEVAQFKNPLITIANYVFDSLTADVFYIENNQLHESLVELQTQDDNIKDNRPIDWEHVNIKYHNKPVSSDYYPDKQFNQVLKLYQDDQLHEGHIIFPTGSLNAMKNLNKIANNKLLLLISDKSFISIPELAQQGEPELDVHGSFSLMVNLHAMCEFNGLSGGQNWIPTSRDGLTTAVLSTGIDLNKCPLFSYQLKFCFEEFSPTDYYNFYDHATRELNNWHLNELVSLLNLSCWDPGLFQIMADRLLELVEESDSQVIDMLVAGLPNVAENFYFTPDCEDTLFSIGALYYDLDYHEEAIDLFEISDHFFPEEFPTYFNMGLAHYYMGNNDEALHYLEKALELDSSANDCRAHIQKIKRAQEKLPESDML